MGNAIVTSVFRNFRAPAEEAEFHPLKKIQKKACPPELVL